MNEHPERIPYGGTLPGGLLTIREVADHIGTSSVTVRRRIADGSLRVVRLGDGRAAPIRIRASELDSWLVAHEQEATAA